MKTIATPLLLIWAAISTVLFLLGVAFAGGLGNVFVTPKGADFLSLVLWAVAWIILVAPFLLILIRLVGKALK